MILAAAAEVLDAIRGYVWILLAAVLIWRLFPVIRKRIESEDFTLEVAGQKVSFQSASRQLHSELDDLRTQVLELVERLELPSDGRAERDEAAAVSETAPPRPIRILWVDDRPENNAFLIKSLKDSDADVTEVTSTDEALDELVSSKRGFDLVISDMGRNEKGEFRPLAGVDLLHRMRDAGIRVPVVIYASRRAVARGGEAARDAGAAAATASPTELLAILRVGPSSAFETSVADIIRRHLNATPFPIRGSVDFVAEQDGERIGIEIKNWSSRVGRVEAERALALLRSARERHGFDRIIMITRPGVELPGIDLPRWITVLTVDELVASLPS